MALATKLRVSFVNRLKNSILSTSTRSNSSSKFPAECKVALITGGARGIGLNFAESLLKCGAKGVILGDLEEAAGEQAACKLNCSYGKDKAFFLKTDVTKNEEFENLFKCAVQKFKNIDIVLNNAGISRENNWSLTVDINAKSVVKGTLLGFQYMGKHKSGKGGTIINVASIFGLQTMFPCPVYCATKHFIIGLDRCFSHEYYKKLTGVTVSTVCPGMTVTPMLTEAAETWKPLEDFEGLKEALPKEAKDLPIQPVEACGDCLLRILCDDDGGIWVTENNECYKIKLPDRHKLRDDKA